jgi:hypothetical protein
MHQLNPYRELILRYQVFCGDYACDFEAPADGGLLSNTLLLLATECTTYTRELVLAMATMFGKLDFPSRPSSRPIPFF